MKAVELSGLEGFKSLRRAVIPEISGSRQIAQKEEKLMATTILGTAFHPLIAEPRPATMGRIWSSRTTVLCGRFYGGFSPRKDMRSMSCPMPFMAWKRLRQGVPAAVVLDLRRPGSSGCDVCKKIANWIPGLPLVILSACLDVPRKVLLLEMGADDYVTIPFSPRELVARLRAVIRRASRFNPEGLYVFADVIVDSSKTEITRGGEQVIVTRKEFKTLEFLTKNALRVISRDELLEKVWGYENYPCTRTVDNHMLRLRQKLEKDPSNPSHLLTVHGLGYKFVP